MLTTRARLFVTELRTLMIISELDALAAWYECCSLDVKPQELARRYSKKIK